MHIVIPDDYQNTVRTLDCFSKIDAHQVSIYTDTVTSLDALTERFYPAEALVLIRERTAITRALLKRLPNLKLISQTGKGTAHIDLVACAEHGVTVCAGTGSPTAPAELTWALVLAAMRRLPAEIASMKAGGWQQSLGESLYGRTLGIFSYGKIGSLVAGYGRAFGMRVIVWGRDGSRSRAQADGFEIAASQRDLFARSDVLSLHVKLTKETRGIVTPADLAAMKPTALIVNTSRAELIASNALIDALRAGCPGFAAVDVYESEPITDPDHPLLHLDNAICTPHIGYVEKDSYELYFNTAFDQVLAFVSGTPINVISPGA